MVLPPNLHKKYLDRFDELIQEGEYLYRGLKNAPSVWTGTDAQTARSWTQEEVECGKQVESWLIKYRSLLHQILPLDSPHRELLQKEETFFEPSSRLDKYVYRLKGLKDDFAKGFFSDLSLQIESEVAADYMKQAELLLAEGQTGKYDHVPAAVLIGAVLEKALRTLCDKQEPPIATVKSNGAQLTLNPLIEELKKAGLYNELKAKQLRAWADIRNSAAHGNFDEFSRSDVEGMIKGVGDFLATYMV